MQCSQVRQIADEHGLRIHMDGARIYNAAIALVLIFDFFGPFDYEFIHRFSLGYKTKVTQNS